MNNKGFSNVILVIGLVILVGIAGYFIFVKKSGPVTQKQTSATSNIPAPTPSPTLTEETTNWKTYRNEKYGIEFRYPSQWQLTEAEASPSQFLRIKLSGQDVQIESRNVPIEGFFTISDLAELRKVRFGTGESGYGGYTYDFEKDKFYAYDVGGMDTSPVEKTWTDITQEKKMPIIQTQDGLPILAFGSFNFPCVGNTHYIFHRQKKLALIFSIDVCQDPFGLTPVGRKLLEDYSQNLQRTLEQITQSVRFF